jgi:hypothetical protein
VPTYFTITICNKKTGLSHLGLLQSVLGRLQFNEQCCYGASIADCMTWEPDPNREEFNVKHDNLNVSYYPEPVNLCKQKT